MPSALGWYANCIDPVSAVNLTAFFGCTMSQANKIPYGRQSITEADILASLALDQRQALNLLNMQRDALSKQLASIRETPAGDDPVFQAWSSLAQSLINLKEFIYLQ